jgi:hypothetical protein
VGYTSGYGNSHITERAFEEMETYLRENGRSVPKGWGTGRSYRLRVLTAYYRSRHQKKEAPPHDHSRSVYVAPLGHNCQAFLREETEALDEFDLPFEDLSAHWRDRWLSARLKNPVVLARFRAVELDSCLLSGDLDGNPGADEPTGGA